MNRFLIRHFAGEVEYNVEGFIEKNKDVFFQVIIKVVESRQMLRGTVSNKCSTSYLLHRTGADERRTDTIKVGFTPEKVWIVKLVDR